MLLFWTEIKWTSRDCVEQHLQTYFHPLFLSNWLIMLVQLFFSTLQLQKAKQKSLWHYILSKNHRYFCSLCSSYWFWKWSSAFPLQVKYSEMQCFLSDYCSISSYSNLKSLQKCFNNKHTNIFSSLCSEKINQIPGVFLWHTLYKATREKAERVMTIKAMTMGRITPARHAEHHFNLLFASAQALIYQGERLLAPAPFIPWWYLHPGFSRFSTCPSGTCYWINLISGWQQGLPLVWVVFKVYKNCPIAETIFLY